MYQKVETLYDKRHTTRRLSKGREKAAPAIYSALVSGQLVTISDLRRDPRNRDDRLPAVILLLKRKDVEWITPDESFPLQLGDRLLLAGRLEAKRQMSWVERNHNSFHYLVTGHERAAGRVWKWITRFADEKH